MVNDDALQPQPQPQSHAQLKAHLQALHTSLADTGTVDAELHALLRQLDGDIHHLLSQRIDADPAVAGTVPGTVGGASLAGAATDDGLSTRAQELAARFAAQHPRMEPALRQLGNMLANMGI